MSGRFGRVAQDLGLRDLSEKIRRLNERIEAARVVGNHRLLSTLMSERKKLMDAVQQGGADSEEQVAGAQRSGLATDPPVSEEQRRAMEAALHGKSTLGIPKGVARKFVGAGADK